MNNNRYYILAIGLLNLVSNKEVVEKENTVRKNIAKNKFVCKTKEGVEVPPYFSGKPSFNQNEAIEYLNNPANGFVETEI